jgi:hypothetical protein
MIQEFETKNARATAKTCPKEKKWKQRRIDESMKTRNRCTLRLFPPRSKHSGASRAKQHRQEGEHRRHGAAARTGWS